MRCPNCQAFDSGVTDSRTSGDTIRRRRRCAACKERFTTYEVAAEEIDGMVFRVDGRVSGVAARNAVQLARIYADLSAEDSALLMAMARRLGGDEDAASAPTFAELPRAAS